MTMVPMWKKCPKCHRKYGWNPDVGNFNCPYCHGLGKPGGGILENVFGKKDASENVIEEKKAEPED